MRVLVLHQHYWPEIAATAQLLTDLCEDLSASGHDVTVLTGQPSYRKVEGLAATLPAREEHHGVRIHRCASYTPSRRSIPRRLLHYASFFGTSLAAALVESRPDVVLVLSTPPLLLGLSGALLRGLRDVPFVYAVQDLYPDVALDLGVLPRGRLADGIAGLSRALYRTAAEVVTLSDGMAARLAVKGVPPERLTVIPNWADTDAIRPGPRDGDFARRHGLADGFVVLFSGNVGRTQGLEILPAAAELLRELPVHFAVVGDGDARAGLQAEVARRGLSAVRFLPPQPRELLPELLASCDVGLVPMRRGIGADLVPSKLYGLLAAGRPVVAAVEPDSEVAAVVRGERCGVVVAPEDPVALSAGVRALYTAGDSRAAQGARGRAACERRFSRSRCTAAYEVVLRRAVEDRS